MRRLRLDSLADAPDAFAATFQAESAMPEARWEERLRSNIEGVATASFLAETERGPCGLAVGVWLGGKPPTVALNALWVAPEARRCGAARAIMDAVEDWARTRGATRMELEVTETSHAARALYESTGYEVAGAPAPTCGQRRALAFKMYKSLD
jgi:GNAT superfamily N-acetyltransferase